MSVRIHFPPGDSGGRQAGEGCTILLFFSDQIAPWAAQLKEVQGTLGALQEGFRLCEQVGEFGAQFVELARSANRQQQRAALVKTINEQVGPQQREPGAALSSASPPAPGQGNLPGR